MIGSNASAGGLAGGIHWRDPIDPAIPDSQPVASLQARVSAAQLRAAAWADLRKKAQALRNAASEVAGTGLRSKRVDVSAPSLLAASVTEGASPGIHSVRVMAIASAETLGSDLFGSRATALGLAGELRVAATRIEIEAGDSLDDVARRFNDVSSTTGVTASVLGTGTGASRLILASRNTGAEGIDLVDGSAGVLRSLGFLDASARIKNGTTSGARGDRFSDGVTAVGRLLGFTAIRPETIDLGGVSATLDLSTMSLIDIAGAINAAASTAGRAVTASVIDDGTGKRLDVRNTTAFTDAGRILEALGVLQGGRGAEAHIIQSDVLGDGGSTPATAATLVGDLWTWGVPAQVQAGDTLTVTGTRGDGTAFTIGFTIGAGDDLQDLLNRLNSATDAFGAGSRTARASLASGRIRVTDDTPGSSRQDLRIVSHNEGGGSLDFGIFDVASTGRARQITAGADAEVEVDGSYLRQASNSVSDAVPGLTFKLGAADPDTTVVVQVSDDAEANIGAIRALIEACNDLAGFADSQLLPPAEGQAPAPLYNDSVLRTLRSTLRSGLGAVLDATVTGGPARLLDIGIEIDRDGRYTIDARKLADAVVRQGEAVACLFGVCGSGLERLGQDLLGDTGGSVEAGSDRIERSIALLQDRVEVLASRLERRRAVLIARFSAMEQAMSLAQSQSAWLEAQIQRLPASPSA